MARCDSCGRDKETVEHGGRQLCLACLRAGGVPVAPASAVASEAALAGARAPRETEGPVCYLIVEPNRLDNWAIPIFEKVKEILAEEDLGYTLVTFLDGGDPQLRPDDMAVMVEVTEYDLGDRLIRYFFGPLAWFHGACELSVVVHIRHGDGGSTEHYLDVRRWLGWFGGSGVDLMDANFRTIAAKIARKVTGRWLLNTTVYQLALASLIVGLASLIPFLGMFLAVPGLILGIIAVAAIWSRGLPRRKGVAVAGVLFCLLGLFVTVYLMMPPQRSGDRIAGHPGGRTEAIEVEPKDAEAYHSRGVAHSREGDHDRAIADLTKAIEFKPDLAEAYASRAAAYSGKGEYDSAIADCARAIELKPGFAEAYVSRAAAYNEKGDYDRGIADCARAIELKPDCAEAYNSRGAACGMKGELDRAIADSTKAIQLRPDYAEAYYNRGLAYAEKGDYDSAIADFTKAIKLKPDDPEPYCDRGASYGERGEYDREIADHTKAIQLKPDYAEAYYNRGFAYVRKRNRGRARSDFERAAALDPRGPVGGAALRALRSMEER